jgi:hypothetical protein
MAERIGLRARSLSVRHAWSPRDSRIDPSWTFSPAPATEAERDHAQRLRTAVAIKWFRNPPLVLHVGARGRIIIAEDHHNPLVAQDD